MYLRIICVISIFATIPLAWSASFDCDKALTNIEKLICDNTGVSELDESVAGRYQKIKGLNLGFDAEKKSQREWLKERNLCHDISCLRKAYLSRIHELDEYIDTMYQKSLNYEDGTIPCQIVAKAVNDASLYSLSVRPEHDQLQKVSHSLPKYFPDALLDNSLDTYIYEDVDLDGVREHVAVMSEGTARISTLFVRRGIPSEKTFTYSARTFGGPYNMFIIRLGSRYFLLAGTYAEPNALWGFNNSDTISYMCQFSTEYSPMLSIRKGADKRVCNEFYSGDWQRVEYKYPHSINLPHNLTGRFWSKYPGNKVAEVDIDNDGNNESIVELAFSHGGGRGCDALYIAATNNTRTSIPEEGINEIIERHLWGYPCGADTHLFTFDGETYIEQDDSDGKVVSQITGTQFKNICVYGHDKKTIGLPVSNGVTYGNGNAD